MVTTLATLGVFYETMLKMNFEPIRVHGLPLVSYLFPLQPKEVNLFICSRILIIKALFDNYFVFGFMFLKNMLVSTQFFFCKSSMFLKNIRGF